MKNGILYSVKSIIILLFMFVNSNILAQKVNSIILFEKIGIKHNFSKIQKVHNVIVDSFIHKQKIVSRSYSVEPNSTYTNNNVTYAEWIIKSFSDIDHIEITTEIILQDFDLDVIMNENKVVPYTHQQEEYVSDEKYIDTKYKKLIEQSKSLKGETDLQSIENIFNFVVDHMSYKNFENPNRGSKKTFNQGLGDCTEYAELTITLCRILNIPAKYVNGYVFHEEKQVGYHNWTEVYTTDTGWIPLDPTFADNPRSQTSFNNLGTKYIYVSNNRQQDRTFIIIDGRKKYFPVRRFSFSNFSVGYSFYKENQNDKALSIFKKLIELESDNFQYYNLAGMCHARLNEFDAALNYLQYAYKLCPKKDKHEIIYSLSNFYALKGDKSSAISHLKRAIELGYEHLEHVLKDEDLKSIRSEEEFIQLTKQLELGRK